MKRRKEGREVYRKKVTGVKKCGWKSGGIRRREEERRNEMGGGEA